MNTANLQLEGLYAAVAALTDALRAKGLLSGGEIEAALKRAEETATRELPAHLSAANVDAICFPLRYLRIANQAAEAGRELPFFEIARLVGEHKPPR